MITTAVLRAPRWSVALSLVVVGLLVAAVVRDYIKVEKNIQALRFERARIGILPVQGPPDVVVLTQLSEQIKLSRFEPQAGLDHATLNWIHAVATMRPGLSELYKLSFAYARNGREEEARIWLSKLCKITPEGECAMARRAWAAETGLRP